MNIQEYVEYIINSWTRDASGNNKDVYFINDKYVLKITQYPHSLYNNPIIQEYTNYKIYNKLGLSHLLAKTYLIGKILVDRDYRYYIIQERVDNKFGDNDSYNYHLQNTSDMDKIVMESTAYLIVDDACTFNFGYRHTNIVCLDYTNISISKIHKYFSTSIYNKLIITMEQRRLFR